jgi:hypothetical protein
MEKLCVGPMAAGKVDIRDRPTENLRRIADALGAGSATSRWSSSSGASRALIAGSGRRRADPHR